MKQTIRSGALALACLLALLCAGCAKNAGEARADPAQAPAESAPPAPPAPVAGETGDHSAAYAAYLDVLGENREAILGYDWQKGMTFNEDYYETMPVGVTEPVAFADVWGDETPELLFLAAEDTDGWRYAARLNVYTWDGEAARALLDDVTMDGQVGGGMNYRLFRTAESKNLWLYADYHSEGEQEVYTRYAAEGAMEAEFGCEHDCFPVELSNGDWGLEDTWAKDGETCIRTAYEASVPSAAEQASGLLLRNAMYYEYDDDMEKPEDTYDYPESGAALTYDGAVAYLRGELGVEPEAVDEAAFFASLPKNFSFLSGAGGWSTELYMEPDGTFTGDYHDSEMGDSGDAYPYGTVYVCSFSGRFGNVKRVDDYSYSMRLLELSVDPASEKEWIEDGVRYVLGSPYGLENADEVMVYLPGAWLRALPMEFVTWVSMPHAWGTENRPVLLPFYGLYNVAEQEGWSSWDDSAGSEVRVDWADDIVDNATEYDVFTMERGEPQARVLFTAPGTVTEFEVLSLSVRDVTEDGRMLFDTRVVYEQSELTPERALLVETVFYGDSPNLGVAYVDENGVQQRFAVDVSGMDGSLYLIEF